MTTTTATENPEAGTDRLGMLRALFPDKSIGKLPKPLVGKDQDRGKCLQGHKNGKGWPISADGHFCGGYHARAVHLDYVGHAAVTDRLLTVDPCWNWEPAAWTPEGLPALDREGNLWVRLTVAGVTRLGVGDGPSMKEKIGDAIRNAAMRYGVALSLWGKDELESAHPTLNLSEGLELPAENRADHTAAAEPAPAAQTTQAPTQHPAWTDAHKAAWSALLAQCDNDKDKAKGALEVYGVDLYDYVRVAGLAGHLAGLPDEAGNGNAAEGVAA